MQAALVAAATAAATLCSLFNYLVGGVSGKVGAAVGANQWDLVAVRTRLSLACGLGAGCLGAIALALVKGPICRVMELQPAVVDHLAGYWQLRCVLVPLTLLNMSLSGILQGYNLVSCNAVISVAQSVLDAVGTALVLQWPHAWHSGTLTGVGLVTVANAAAACVAGLWCVLYLAPQDAHAVFRRRTSDRRHEMDNALSPNLAPPAAKQPEMDGLLPHAVEPPSSGQGADDGAHLLDFFISGWHMLIRSLLIQACESSAQATFFLAATIAARLGTAALAAHAIVSQLWILASYVVDGFAVAGTVLGSRLVALQSVGSSVEGLRTLTRRLILLAVGLGCAAMLLFAAFESQLIGLFTRDTQTIRILHGPLWTVLAVAQPINAADYVLDGLLYATQSFPFVAAMMASGFALAFVPVLVWSQLVYHSVWGIWLAKAALNVWRLGLASAWLQVKFLRTPVDYLSGPA